MEDIQLSADLWLHEFPCWEHALPDQVQKLRETSARVLQPVRNRWGPVVPTSWMWWRSGCVPRTGSHAQGGTVDFVTPDADMTEVFEWGSTYLLPSGYIGRWIYEPETAFQGEHIHMAPREDMLAYNGDGRIMALRELPSGDTYVYRELTEGSFADPYRLDPIVVTAEAGLGKWFGLGLLLGLITFDVSGRAAGGWQIGGG